MPEIATNRENNTRPAPAAPPLESVAQAAPVSRPGWSAREEAAWWAGRKVGGRGLAAHIKAWFMGRDRVAAAQEETWAKVLGVRAGESAGFRLVAEIERLQRRAGELDPGGYLANDLDGLRRIAEVAMAEAEG